VLVKLKLFLILKKRLNKSILKFVENELDHFLRTHGFVIVSYEVREE